jgi:hypothetical protein
VGWNYRVIRRAETEAASGTIEFTFGIHEVYYRDDEVDDRTVSASEVGFTERPVPVVGESVEALRTTLELMLTALDKPVLDDGERGAP